MLDWLRQRTGWPVGREDRHGALVARGRLLSVALLSDPLWSCHRIPPALECLPRLRKMIGKGPLGFFVVDREGGLRRDVPFREWRTSAAPIIGISTGVRAAVYDRITWALWCREMNPYRQADHLACPEAYAFVSPAARTASGVEIWTPESDWTPAPAGVIPPGAHARYGKYEMVNLGGEPVTIQ